MVFSDHVVSVSFRLSPPLLALEACHPHLQGGCSIFILGANYASHTDGGTSYTKKLFRFLLLIFYFILFIVHETDV